MSVAINSNYYAGYTMNSANKFKKCIRLFKIFDYMQKCFCID